jgi:hypothetical protein
VRYSCFEANTLTLSVVFIAATILSARAEPSTLTLSCKGTTTSYETKTPAPISLGLFVDFSKKTIKGFPFPSEVQITQVTELHVLFGKTTGTKVLNGAIDRVTGEVEGRSAMYKSLLSTEMLKPGNVEGGFTIALKCKPTQRTFVGVRDLGASSIRVQMKP